MISLEADAHYNFAFFKDSSYLGRWMLMGRTPQGKIVQMYSISGRSENSRNRVFNEKNPGEIWTELADGSRGGDTSLIIYRAMAEIGCSSSRMCVMSNGDQTDTIINNWQPQSLTALLASRQYEPDKPNYTPRISGIYNTGDNKFEFSVLRKSPFGDECDRIHFGYSNIGAGFGYFLSTYTGDAAAGEPLPSWQGEPLLMPIKGETVEDIANEFWNSMNENRVSLATKIIPESGESRIHIINQSKLVPPAT